MKSKNRSSKLKLALSAGLLAGTVATTSFSQDVHAQEVTQGQAQALHNEYVAAREEEDASQKLSEVKSQLVGLIEQAGGSELVAQLDVQALSESELDNVFTSFINYLAQETAEVETAETTSEVEKVETKEETVAEQAVAQPVQAEDKTEEKQEEKVAEEVVKEETTEEEETVEDEKAEETKEEVVEEAEDQTEAKDEKADDEDPEVVAYRIRLQEEAAKEHARQAAEEKAQREAEENGEKAEEKSEEETVVEEDEKAETSVKEAEEAVAEPKEVASEEKTDSTEEKTEETKEADKQEEKVIPAKEEKQAPKEEKAVVKEVEKVTQPAKISKPAQLVNKVAQPAVKAPEVNTPSRQQAKAKAQKVVEARVEAKVEKKLAQGVVLSPEEFINLISAEVQRYADEYNIYASVMMAQAALQSGWGTSATAQAPNNNVMGITAGSNEQGVEYRTYENIVASLKDYAELIRNGVSWDKNFYSGAWRENAATYEEATKWLTGRYAIDPNYHLKLNELIKRYNLTRFDVQTSGQVSPSTESAIEKAVEKAAEKQAQGSAQLRSAKQAQQKQEAPAKEEKGASKPAESKQKPAKEEVIEPKETEEKVKPAEKPQPQAKQEANQQSNAKSGKTYTVQPGDSLSGIASKTNSTVTQIVESNKGLDAGNLQVGQNIVTPAKEAAKPEQQVETPKPAAKPSTAQETQTNAQGWVRPTAGVVTSRYGWRSYPLNPSRRDFHMGVDISSGTNSPVVAAKAGTVTASNSGYNWGYGNYVDIDHGDGLMTRYAHLAPGWKASVGQKVAAGERIGTQGTTGASTGVHLHFEIHKNGKHTNPENYMKF
ncbi:peptidoglycan DD-metalloendopeptidase family protein [Dolosigranulum pigrum]|uniref:peptidoglycan DD-metalloendopeptidase family protein n=1 Tax=Dolosigranulum pigrum TaxID=29394 RepID=UPI001AD88873|nr:peptidoglycan DD-metalloendopeptidase family protein [Dolosigranulum pigrum]QTJ35149.1 LysM peptidoglycan-binding domain-containing protein [Dolosigranulum pigrum]QTJ40312.1 LysM peptidoglycan-binding domain-containing protein [Dolosigranulum pigrum]QTJ48795.1 LysM peptidoglycan-binding domain-containing protein [Dolosigranulum pigrum]